MVQIYELYVRDTPHLIWRVYRSMDGELTDETEGKALTAFPGLTREDLMAVVKTVRTYIETIDRDEKTGRLILSKDKLVHGRYYKGRCRNATVARWHAFENRFYHWRVKFKRIFVETIKYPTDEYLLFDIFNPVEELAASKFEIPFVDFEQRHTVRFEGDRHDLVEFEREMWSRPPVGELRLLNPGLQALARIRGMSSAQRPVDRRTATPQPYTRPNPHQARRIGAHSARSGDTA